MKAKRHRNVACGALLGVITSFTTAAADDVPFCPPPPGVTSIKLPDGLPPAIRSALSNEAGDIALPGEDFDATDLVMTGRSWRFIFVWQSADRWIVATEHGGIGYNDPVFLYRLEKDGQKATLLEKRHGFPKTVCQVATGLVR